MDEVLDSFSFRALTNRMNDRTDRPSERTIIETLSVLHQNVEFGATITFIQQIVR